MNACARCAVLLICVVVIPQARAAEESTQPVVATLSVHVTDLSPKKLSSTQVAPEKRVVQLVPTLLEQTRAKATQPTEVAVGSIVYIRSPSENDIVSYTVDPPQGVLESPPGTYHLPRGYVGLMRAVSPGNATVTFRSIGKIKAGSINAGCSNCWSGYVLEGGPFGLVQGQWTVPAVQPQGGSQDSAIWVGIDGFGPTSLIQVGTDQSYSCCILGPSYSAWYQVLPADEFSVGIPYPVSPGDVMMAWIAALDSNGQVTDTPPAQNVTSSWIITLNNTTQHWVFSKKVSFAGTLSTAEWIVEAPTFCSWPSPCAVTRIANYGSVAFDLMDAVCPPAGAANCQGLGPQPPDLTHAVRLTIAQAGDSGWTYFSTPSEPDGDNDGFTAQYSAPTQLTPLPPGPIIMGALPSAVLNQPYSHNIGSIQDSAPSWQLTGGSLPPGVTLSSTGLVSGTPTSVGAFTFSVRLTDQSTPSASAEQQVVLSVSPAPPPGDFGLAPSSSIQQRRKGNSCSGSTRIKIVPINGFLGAVALTVAPPSVLTATLTPASTSSSSTLKVSADFCDSWPSAINITGTHAGVSHTVSVGIIAPQCGKPGQPMCK